MILISHRGNIKGSNRKRENTPEYISEAMNLGYDVEVDVWFVKGSFWLGHDNPDVKIKESYLENKKLWCHAKNLPALERMLKNKKIHCFWHQEDDFQITSNGYIWTYPDKPLCQNSIAVLPTDLDSILSVSIAGICLDDFSGLDISGTNNA